MPNPCQDFRAVAGRRPVAGRTARIDCIAAGPSQFDRSRNETGTNRRTVRVPARFTTRSGGRPARTHEIALPLGARREGAVNGFVPKRSAGRQATKRRPPVAGGRARSRRARTANVAGTNHRSRPVPARFTPTCRGTPSGPPRCSWPAAARIAVASSIACRNGSPCGRQRRPRRPVVAANPRSRSVRRANGGCTNRCFEPVPPRFSTTCRGLRDRRHQIAADAPAGPTGGSARR